MQIQPFSSDLRCTKCGSNQIASRYCSPTQNTRHDHPQQEHLDRHCQRCFYTWMEQPKDAPPLPIPGKLEERR